MIMNSYIENREEQQDDEFLGNFYTYVKLVSKVTDNREVIKVFKGLKRWMHDRAWKYCADIVSKSQKGVAA